MKKIALCFSACLLLAACQSETKKGGAADAKASSSVAQIQVDTSVAKIGTEHTGGPVAPAIKLMMASDCASCHKEQEKLVGPAYADIARRYPSTDANIALLAGRIIKGGKGHWGEIPMTPHPGLPLADAKEMTQYILSLK